MASPRQKVVASVTRLYPFYSGCGKIACSRIVRSLAGTGLSLEWVRLDTGAMLHVPVGDFAGTCAFFLRDVDPKITWVCSRVLRKGDTALDIGANIGLVTVAMAALVGPTGQVHSFEPNPDLVALIRDSVAANGFGQVTVHAVALGEACCEKDLFVPFLNCGSGSLVNRSDERGHTVSVPVRVLSDYLASLASSHIRFVKIDVEGYEAQVLAGARSLFAENPPDAILFELNKHDNGFWSDPTVTALSEMGYGFFGIPRRMLWMKLVRVDRDRVLPPGIHDYLAARTGSVYEEIAAAVRA